MSRTPMQTRVRQPAVAGRFYPADADELAEMVDGHVAEGVSLIDGVSVPRAVVAPHAGFVYSGPTAGVAFAGWTSLSGQIDRVLILGPSHHVAFMGAAVSSAEAFATPLGQVPVDRDAVNQLLQHPSVRVGDRPHEPEHAIETHLPYLQRVLGSGFKIVPMLVGDSKPSEVASWLDELQQDERTLVSISSDLSHYHDYATARSIDSTMAA